MAPNPRRNLPTADEKQGLVILRAFARDRSLLTPLRMMYLLVGNVFQITLPGFRPAVFVGPEANRQLLVGERSKFSWRVETDPVTKLLRRGLLVTDDEEHDHLRALMEPALQRDVNATHVPPIWAYTHVVTQTWHDGETRDMLVEMRRVALLILMGCLFGVDFAPDMERLWQPILRVLNYISPGLWIFSPHLPRPGYRGAIRTLDDYLYRIIRERRAHLKRQPSPQDKPDLLTRLCAAPELDDAAIRDQLLTMLIAGHDTSTALLSWTLYLLGAHPDTMQAAREEVRNVLGEDGTPPSAAQLNRLELLNRVLHESLRLYPPIHIGNRRANQDVTVLDYHVPRDTRIMYSIYLAHRDPHYWENAEQFCPERFHPGAGNKPPPLTYLPFGGGPRNCIGAAFSQLEAQAVLAQLLRAFDFELLNGHAIKPHMGATLEPRPGVKMLVRRIRP